MVDFTQVAKQTLPTLIEKSNEFKSQATVCINAPTYIIISIVSILVLFVHNTQYFIRLGYTL